MENFVEIGETNKPQEVSSILAQIESRSVSAAETAREMTNAIAQNGVRIEHDVVGYTALAQSANHFYTLGVSLIDKNGGTKTVTLTKDGERKYFSEL